MVPNNLKFLPSSGPARGGWVGGRRGNNGGTGERSSQPDTQGCSHFQAKFTHNVENMQPFSEVLYLFKNFCKSVCRHSNISFFRHLNPSVCSNIHLSAAACIHEFVCSNLYTLLCLQQLVNMNMSSITCIHEYVCSNL